MYHPPFVTRNPSPRTWSGVHRAANQPLTTMRPGGCRTKSGMTGGRSPYPSGASIDLGGVLNHCGPASVMWKQSSIRTPNVPGA